MACFLAFSYSLQFCIAVFTFEIADTSLKHCYLPLDDWSVSVLLSGSFLCLCMSTPVPLFLLFLVEEFLSVSVWSGILKEISPEYSLEKLMVKLKMQYFGCRMRRTDSLHGDCNHESKRRLLLGRKVMTT